MIYYFEYNASRILLQEYIKNIRIDKKLVFTNGVFDILHAGHVYYLNQAKELGDILIVGINSDQSVQNNKGKNRPIQKCDDRAFVISNLECCDCVVIFNEDDPYRLIDSIVPDILAKGSDYSVDKIVGKDIVEKNGGEVKTIPFVEGYSTSKIIEKIKLS